MRKGRKASSGSVEGAGVFLIWLSHMTGGSERFLISFELLAHSWFTLQTSGLFPFRHLAAECPCVSPSITGWHGTHMVGWLEVGAGGEEKQNRPEPPVNALLLFVFYLKKWLEFILLPGKAASLYDDKIAEFTRKFIYIGFERQTLQWQTPAKTWACWLSHFPWQFCRRINPLTGSYKKRG